MIKLQNILWEASVRNQIDFGNNGIYAYVADKRSRFAKIITTDKAIGFVTSYYNDAKWSPKSVVPWDYKEFKPLVNKSAKIQHRYAKDFNKRYFILLKVYSNKKKGTLYVIDEFKDDIKRIVPIWLSFKPIPSNRFSTLLDTAKKY